MPDSTLLERLQPYLLDRLTDDEPDAQQESRDKRGISMRRYRDGVLRDLEWLLNAVPYPFDEEMEGSEDLAISVLNYGFRDLCGLTASSLSIPEIERELARAIQRFEPRILRNTLSVRVIADPESAGNHLGFEIKGDLWAMPKPEYLDIKTEIDLETGKCPEFRAQEGG